MIAPVLEEVSEGCGPGSVAVATRCVLAWTCLGMCLQCVCLRVHVSCVPVYMHLHVPVYMPLPACAWYMYCIPAGVHPQCLWVCLACVCICMCICASMYDYLCE